MRPVCLYLFVACLFVSCFEPDKQGSNLKKYFDLDSYFSREAIRLTRLNKPVLKAVSKNSDQEKKSILVTNWGNELTLFKASDINKPAWRDSYSASVTDSLIHYKANDPKLRTQEINIHLDKKKQVKHISILNKSDNVLYSSDEKLDYFPDSTYLIDKHQHVILIGNNHYLISGNFKAGQ